MNFEQIIQGLPETELAYLADPYLKECHARILRAVKEGGSYYVVLDKTIFHPKSGGQPSDTGIIIHPEFQLKVKKSFRVGRHIILWGKSESQPKETDVLQKIDWGTRYLYMRRHAAAHLFDAALEKVKGEASNPKDSWLGDECYVGYSGEVPGEGEVKRVVEFMQNCIKENLSLSSRIVSKEEVKEERELWRKVIQNLDMIRLVQIDNFRPVPCGGTHVESLGEIGSIQLRKILKTEDGFRIYYDVK